MLSFRNTPKSGWVVFGPAAELKPGHVTVTKRDGGTKQANVVRVSKPFTVNGVPHVYGYLGDCDCSDTCCNRQCRCGRECACRGGNIYDCEC